jgi:hypothetical protein
VVTGWNGIFEGSFVHSKYTIIRYFTTIEPWIFPSGSVNSRNFAASRVPPTSAWLILLSVVILVMNRMRFHLRRLQSSYVIFRIMMHVFI